MFGTCLLLFHCCMLAYHMGMVPPSAGCDYASVEQVNRDTVNPLLRRLVQTPFMRYFKVNCRR